MDAVDTLLDLYEANGTAMYGSEAVTQREHALQAAACAESAGAAPALVAAALLHDVGHLLAKIGMDGQTNDHHEDIGWGYLKSQFGPAVAEPVRLHVPAKRYLCTAEPGYFAILSPASVHSLELQGGRFSAGEAETFRRTPFAADAVELRRWDDQAKVPGTRTRTMRDYAPLLRGLVL
jgi:phosphonate degradation associated HDIG domain protein